MADTPPIPAVRRQWERASAAEKARGVRSKNNLKFEELRKPRYNLSESADDMQAIDESFELRVVDMAGVVNRPDDPAVRRSFAADLGTALEQIGFAVLVGHGIDSQLHAEAHRRTPTMFTDVSGSVKQQYRAERLGAVNQGWFPMEETSNLHPDQVEGWVWTRRAFRLPGGATATAPLDRLWPQPTQELFWRSVVQANERLVHPIFRAMLDHAGVGIDEAEPLLRAIRQPAFALRLNYCEQQRTATTEALRLASCSY